MREVIVMIAKQAADQLMKDVRGAFTAFLSAEKLVVRKSVIHRIAAVEYLILAGRVSTPRDRTR